MNHYYGIQRHEEKLLLKNLFTKVENVTEQKLNKQKLFTLLGLRMWLKLFRIYKVILIR